MGRVGEFSDKHRGSVGDQTDAEPNYNNKVVSEVIWMIKAPKRTEASGCNEMAGIGGQGLKDYSTRDNEVPDGECLPATNPVGDVRSNWEALGIVSTRGVYTRAKAHAISAPKFWAALIKPSVEPSG